jgi:large subunit ribosomal protein L24
MVKVLAGEDRSKQGRVLEVDRNRMRRDRGGPQHQQEAQQAHHGQPQGGIVEKEGPIHVSNLMLIDAKTGDAGPRGS